ncbi:MAG: hypothetical protein ACTH8R_13065, partial [Glutamicibacter arilaitensis]
MVDLPVMVMVMAYRHGLPSRHSVLLSPLMPSYGHGFMGGGLSRWSWLDRPSLVGLGLHIGTDDAALLGRLRGA